MNAPKALIVSVILVSLVALLSGCASVGHDFKHENTPTLELGETHSSEYKSLFGEPTAVEMKDNADGKFELARYVYARANMGSARARILDLEFRDGLLNAFHYASSFDKDKTVMHSEQLNQIQRGSSRKDDVLRILGKPHGRALCPSYNADFKDKCGKGNEIWVWTAMNKLSTFGAAYGGDQVEMHNVFISFDGNGVVTDVESSATKNL